MRRLVVVLCAGVLWGADGCDKLPAPALQMGQLVFQKDSTCTDTTNTELFVDDVSQGQFTMRPGSTEGFNETAGQHIAKANELAGRMKQFTSEIVTVPALGQGFFSMTCGFRPPPNAPPSQNRAPR
jgi:hypothetical protein